MTETSTVSTIIGALVEVSKDVGAVRKDSYNQGQHFNFRGIDAVVQAVYPAFIKHGIIYCPRVIEKDYSEKPLKNGGVATSVRLTVEATFWHTSGDSLSAVVQAEAFDMGDKATAKAMSVAMRTALLQVLCLPTDEQDPDTYTYEISPAKKNSRAAAEQIEACTSLSELRAMWSTADEKTRERIQARVQQLDEKSQQ